MKDAFMTIKLDSPLRERVENLAKTERRTIADQAAYLMEMALDYLALHYQEAQNPAVPDAGVQP
jgi:predicted transcriptional regulator